MRWSVDPREARVDVTLDGYRVLYHRPSRTTHILGSPAPELIDALADGPADLDTLIARLAARFEIAGDARAAIRARLDELVAEGLATAS